MCDDDLQGSNLWIWLEHCHHVHKKKKILLLQDKQLAQPTTVRPHSEGLCVGSQHYAKETEKRVVTTRETPLANDEVSQSEESE